MSSKYKVLPFYRFNLMIPVSTNMAYQEVREISLRLGEMQFGKKVATLLKDFAWIRLRVIGCYTVKTCQICSKD